MRQIQAVPVLGPAAHQNTHGCAGAGEGDQDGQGVGGFRRGGVGVALRVLGQHGLGDGADGAGYSGGGGAECGAEEFLVLGARLVLHRQ